MPADEIHVLLVPGADRLAFTEDAAQAAERSATVHPLNLPVFAGQPVDGQAAYYAHVAGLIGAALEAGTNCGSCRPELASILAAAQAKVAAE